MGLVVCVFGGLEGFGRLWCTDVAMISSVQAAYGFYEPLGKGNEIRHSGAIFAVSGKSSVAA